MKRLIRSLILALTMLSLVSCGLNNTMYNARKYFKTAQGRAVNAQGKPSAQAVNEYTKTIQKCGIILTEDSRGPKADEAVYLMARALYYKKNAAFQAKDAFESLIMGYPESKYIPDAHLYLARVLREVDQIEASEAVLEQFVRDNTFRKHHAKALLLLTEFEIEDKDYERAQYWLKRIITDYKDSKEFKEASFLYGKNYAVQGKHELSLQEFQKFIKSRGITKEKKLEAQYYIALNQFELGAIDPVLKATKSLIRNEWRPEMLSKAKLLNARALIAKGSIDAGLNAYEDVTKSYPRTEQSAHAYYNWGNYLYHEMGNRDSAIQYLNRVRVEASALDIAVIAQKKAAAIGHTKIGANIDPDRNLQEYLNAYYQRAESFTSPLAMPDSALAVYRQVIAQKDSFALQLDSLTVLIDEMQAEIDSLSIVAAELDSLLALEEAALEEDAEEIATLEEETESPDSIEPEELTADDDEGEEEPPKPAEPSATERLATVNSRLTTLRDELDLLIIKTQTLEGNLQRYEREILPFCYYSIFHLLYQDEERQEEAEQVFGLLQEGWERNLYFVAAEAVKAGKMPSLADPDYEDARELFDLSLDHFPVQPDSLVLAMQGFTESIYHDLRDLAHFRLGWHYTFEEPDSTQAFFHLDFILDEADNPTLATEVRRFYNGTKFLYRDEEALDTLYSFEPLPIIPAGTEVPGREPEEEEAEEALEPEEGTEPDVSDNGEEAEADATQAEEQEAEPSPEPPQEIEDTPQDDSAHDEPSPPDTLADEIEP